MKDHPDAHYLSFSLSTLFFLNGILLLSPSFAFPLHLLLPCQVLCLSFAAVKNRSLCSHRPHSVHSFSGKLYRQGIRAF
ncbi:hypothetical protein F5B18DRAFT_131171 [Nemania serpens]|nr:hypothetical protein F5B18DRAFT_131171 [Nemania serpens]